MSATHLRRLKSLNLRCYKFFFIMIITQPMAIKFGITYYGVVVSYAYLLIFLSLDMMPLI